MEPTLGSSWDEEAGEIVTHHYVNLGIAAATERGLIVPNIPDADRLTLPQLAEAIRDVLQEMHDDGSMADILATYGLEAGLREPEINGVTE